MLSTRLTVLGMSPVRDSSFPMNSLSSFTPISPLPSVSKVSKANCTISVSV